MRGAGALSGETRKRDAARAVETRPTEAVVETAPTPREAEAPARSPGTAPTIAPAGTAAPVPWSPPDPEAIGVSRRQFFNRATVTLTSAGVGAFAAAGFVAFLWPTATGGFGQR